MSRYNRGICSFLEVKQLNQDKAINAFLKHKGIFTFTCKNVAKAEKLIQENWDQFANFIDKAIKNGELVGRDISASNGSWELERQYREKSIYEKYLLSPEEINLFKLICEVDDPVKFSRCTSFLAKKGGQLPANDSERTSRMGKIKPKLQYIIDSPHKDELIRFLKPPVDMKIIKNISSYEVLSIDIETVPIAQTFKELSPDWQAAWEYKNKWQNVNDNHPNREHEKFDIEKSWEEKASLFPEFAKIVAISLTYLDAQTQLKCKSYAGDYEKGILEEFAVDLNTFNNNKRNINYRLLGHATKYFDYPFLCKRYMANGLVIPEMLDESDCKPWDMMNLDTNEMWKSFGTGPGSSLPALCILFGIPTSKDDMSGSDVAKNFYDGKILEIADYCNRDTIADFNVFRKLKGESIFTFDEVIYVNKGQIIEKVPIFTRIEKVGHLTQELHDEICEKATSMNQKERTAFVKFLKASLNKPEGSYTPMEKALFETLKPTKKPAAKE